MILRDLTASPEDGQEILRVLESSAAKGSIELIYTRRPDAYASYMREWGEARVFVSKDGETGRVIGSCAELIRDVWIGGQPARAGYLCGLKKDADYAGTVGFGARLLRTLQRDDIDFYYCSVISDNDTTRAMFERGGRLLSVQSMASFTTHVLSSRVRVRCPRHRYTLRQASENDREALTAFLQREGANHDLFPRLPSPDAPDSLSLRDWYILLDGERIAACGALWNQTGYRQYVVKRYRGIMRAARVLNPILPLFGYIRLPRENVPLDFPMLSFLLARDDDRTLYRAFLHEIVPVIRKQYHMYVIGLPDSHPASPMLRKLPAVRFGTVLYAMRFPWSEQSYKDPDASRLDPECGML